MYVLCFGGPVSVAEFRVNPTLFQLMTKDGPLVEMEDQVVAIRRFDFAKEFLYPDGTLEYSELFFVMFLDRSHQVFAYKLLSSGGMTGTVVDTRLLFQTAYSAMLRKLFFYIITRLEVFNQVKRIKY